MSLSTIPLPLHVSIEIMTSEPTATIPLPEPMDNYSCIHRPYRTTFILHQRRLNIHLVGPEYCEPLATRHTRDEYTGVSGEHFNTVGKVDSD